MREGGLRRRATSKGKREGTRSSEKKKEKKIKTLLPLPPLFSFLFSLLLSSSFFLASGKTILSLSAAAVPLKKELHRLSADHRDKN